MIDWNNWNQIMLSMPPSLRFCRAKVAPGGSEAPAVDGRSGSPPSKNDFTRMVSRKTGTAD